MWSPPLNGLAAMLKNKTQQQQQQQQQTMQTTIHWFIQVTALVCLYNTEANVTGSDWLKWRVLC